MKDKHEALAQRLDQLEKFRTEVQTVCESGTHRTMHTQLQMCSFLDLLRTKALEANEHITEDRSVALNAESEARTIYEGWAEQPGFVSWVDGGNSALQEKARAEANRIHTGKSHSKVAVRAFL